MHRTSGRRTAVARGGKWNRGPRGPQTGREGFAPPLCAVCAVCARGRSSPLLGRTSLTPHTEQTRPLNTQRIGAGVSRQVTAQEGVPTGQRTQAGVSSLQSSGLLGWQCLSDQTKGEALPAGRAWERAERPAGRGPARLSVGTSRPGISRSSPGAWWVHREQSTACPVGAGVAGPSLCPPAPEHGPESG